MIERKMGHIVNVASLAGHSGTNKLVDYCASKFAAVGLDEALRVELNVQVSSTLLLGIEEYKPITLISRFVQYFTFDK